MIRPVLAEKWSGVWNVTYTFRGAKFSLDYTGNIYGPMRLPLAGPLDPREPNSPVWSIQNLQLTYRISKMVELYGGVKNILNWTPAKGNPFLIARTHDPFDKNVVYDSNGQIVANAENPYALSFDPTYMYAPNQGRRGFVGVRVTVQ